MKRILFISPELSYTGAPRSMLEICKTAKELGYDVTVWSAEPGPLESGFLAEGFAVTIVPTVRASHPDTIALIKGFDLAVCNTIETDAFARTCCRYIPTVWYIHEAANIPNFLKNTSRRLDWLETSRDIVCVSEYAAKEIRKYTKRDTPIIRNCIEDVSDRYLKVAPGSSEKVRFIQLGTIEYIKAFDVLLEAFRLLPPRYREKSELYLAGRLLPWISEYTKQILREAEEMDSVTYLGELTATDAMRTIAEMDVVVVASRGESCSMVALEGAMLSRPLIVTEDVGASYLVKEDNGIIVKTGDAESLEKAIEQMIDRADRLKEMGDRSRAYYEEMAGMEYFREELGKLFQLCEKKDSFSFKLERIRNRAVSSTLFCIIRLLKNHGFSYVAERTVKRLTTRER